MVKAVRRAYVTAKENPPHPTWQWIFGLTIAILVSVMGYFSVTLNSLNREVGVAASILERVETKLDSHSHAPEE